MHSLKGFTFIELVVALTIISVAAIFVIPSFKLIKKTEKMSSEIRQVVSSLNMAKFEAIKVNRDVVFQFTPNGYKAFVDGGTIGGEATENTKQRGRREILRHSFMDGLSVKTNFRSNRVRFRKRITSVDPGRVTFYNRSRPYAEVIINFVGRIRVRKM